MQDSNKNSLLAKWLDGSLSEEEAKTLGSDEELAQLRTALDRVGDYGYPPMDVDDLLAKTMQKRTPKKGVIRRLVPVWGKVAAAVILVVGLSWWLMKDGATVVIAQAGEQQKIILPSQSEVILNAGTKLRYYDKNWSEERRLRLEGEAYFKVTKGSSFTIESEHGMVTVLGTQFNIYDRGNSIVVSCYEGRVKVISEQAKLETVLKKGEVVRIKGSQYFSFTTENTTPAWINGVSEFTKASLSNVFDEIERQFDIKIDFFNIDLQRQFTGSFPHSDLELALERICSSMGLSYQLKSNGKKVEIRTK